MEENPYKTERARQWLEGWKIAGEEMERQRRERIRNTNTAEAIEQLNDAFQSALQLAPQRTSSGLVIMQDLLRGLRR